MLSFFIICADNIYANHAVNPDGSFAYSIPIEVPPGTNGIAPSLSLTYNSNAGNGICGVGWQLSGLPYITRDSTYPVNYDGFDHYTGPAGRLVNIGGSVYHYEDENFCRVEAHGSYGDGPEYWVETKPDGTKYYYGYNSGECDFGSSYRSKISMVKGNGSITSNTRVWALSKVQDINGNYYSIKYTQSNGQFYPEEIIYTGNVVTDYDARRSVEFDYESRTDDIADYSSSSRVETYNRLKSITVKLDGDEVRKYTLYYSSTSSYGGLRSRIANVADSGLPAGENFYSFSWTNSPVSYNSYYGNLNYDTENIGNSYFGDYDGDGKLDYMIKNGASLKVFKFNGSGWVDIGQYSGVGYVYNMMVDVNGDNRSDQIMPTMDFSQADYNFHFYHTIRYAGSGTLENVTFGNDAYTASAVTVDARVRYVDVNGDGKCDIVYRDANNNHKFLYRTEPGQGNYPQSGGNWRLGTSVQFPSGSTDSGSDYPCFTYTDATGDGKADIVFIKYDPVSGTVKARVCVNKGSGWQESFTAYSFPSSYSTISDRYTVTDMNGDGLTDIVYRNDNNQHYIYSSTGTSFRQSAYTDILGTESDSAYYNYYDMNGDGWTDIVAMNSSGNFTIALAKSVIGKNWTTVSKSLGNGDKERYRFGDFNGDGRVDILYINKSSDQLVLGTSFCKAIEKISTATPPNQTLTSVVYELPTTMTDNIDDWVADSALYLSGGSGKFMPDNTPRSLVSSLTVHDGVSYYDADEYCLWYEPDISVCYEPDYRKISSTVYSYHNGLIKKGLPYERKSVGFERVASRMGDGTYARNDYIQTGLSFPGRMAYHYEFSSERQTISRKYYTYLEETPYSGVKWIKTDSELSHDYESGVAVSNILREYGYDEGDSGCYGNVTSIAMSVNGNDGLYTEISYSPNQSDWIINRVISVKKWENSSCANLISWSSFGYDNYGWGGNIKTKADYLKEGTSWRAIERNFGYDDYGNITSLSFPNGTGGNSSVITNTYDEDYHTFPVEEISSNDSGTELKTITTYDYATGNKTSVTDANGNTTVYEYDDYGRIVAEKAPGDDWTKQYLYSKEYFPAPYSVVESRFKDDSSLGYSWKREYYDGLKRVVKTESKGYNGHALVQEFSYDLLGRLESKTNQYLSGCDTPQKTEYEYDSAGRPQKAEAPDSTVKRTEYSYAGNLKVLREIDADGNASLSKYDAQGRLRYQVDPSGGTITYNYDALGRLISTVDAGGNVTSIAYDTLGRKTSITDPNTGTTSFTYYDSGDVKTQTNARGVTLTYTYDSLNRITSESSSDGTVRAEYVYDSGTTNNLKGRLYGVDDNSGSTVFSYDARGNVTHTLRSIDSDGDGVEDREFAASFAYDSQKRLVETAYPDANHLVVKRVYGEAGNLHAVTDESGNAFVQYRRSGSTATAMNGHSISRMTGNGVETVVDFNPANMRPVTLETKRGNDVLEQMSYTFRPGGNILSITDGCTSDGNDSESFTYDSVGRLAQAVSASSMYGTRDYVYDAQGNIQLHVVDNSVAFGYTYGSSAHPHAVSSTTALPYNMPVGSYSYDSTGNMTYRNGKTLVYDAKNRLIEVRNGANVVESYVYDFTGARIIKKLADGSAVFSINGMHDLKTTPGFPDQYVNYITGAEGDLAAQIEGVNTAAGASVYPVVKNMYNWKSPAGLMLTINAYASAWLNNPANYRRLGYALFVLLLAACSFVLFYSVRRYKAARSANPGYMLPWPWLRHSVPGILLFFVFTSFGLTGCFDGSVDNTTRSNVKYMHPNHVGSVAMVTDHEGTVVARYKYEPYGKVLVQSTGTGISDYKYTSQKSDATGPLLLQREVL